MLLRIDERRLTTLDPREQEVVVLRYGLDGNPPRTLSDVGKRLGITRERVRQIKEKALLRLRHASRARFLETFMQ